MSRKKVASSELALAISRGGEELWPLVMGVIYTLRDLSYEDLKAKVGEIGMQGNDGRKKKRRLSTLSSNVSVSSILLKLKLKEELETMKNAIVEIYLAGQIGMSAYDGEMNNIPRSILSCMISVQYWFEYFKEPRDYDPLLPVTLLDVSIPPSNPLLLYNVC